MLSRESRILADGSPWVSHPGLLDSAILFGPVSNADATSLVKNPKEEVG